MLDELRMPAREASAGFPDHPHRGFETCSIMLSGKMEHCDSVGNKVRSEGMPSCPLMVAHAKSGELEGSFLDASDQSCKSCVSAVLSLSIL